MKHPIKKLRAGLRRLGLSESGAASVEFAIVFFEGLRESNINLKATYTISDLLSRETELIDQNYLDGMNDVYAWLSRSANPVSMRVTVVGYDEANDRHVNIWSRGVAGQSNLTQEGINETISPHIPIMADANSAIVVETWTTYDPIMDIGLAETDIYNIVVTAPRFSEQLIFEGINDGTGTGHDDDTGNPDDGPTT